MKMAPNMTVRIMLLPRIFSAQRTSLSPRTMDILADEPAPTREPRAWIMFIIGIVMPRPAMARALTPWPMNIRSAML